jgi:hypothetical protein
LLWGTGWGCVTLATLIREAFGQRRMGVAVQHLFNTITTTTTTVIIIIVITVIMTSVVVTLNGLPARLYSL